MDDVFSNFDLVLRAFWLTIQLAVLSGVVSLVFGTLLAALRVGPVSVLRLGAGLRLGRAQHPAAGGVRVRVHRRSELGWFVQNHVVHFRFFNGVIALSVYTSAFVCEAVRSGINSVSLGQAEAARRSGMTFASRCSRWCCRRRSAPSYRPWPASSSR